MSKESFSKANNGELYFTSRFAATNLERVLLKWNLFFGGKGVSIFKYESIAMDHFNPVYFDGVNVVFDPNTFPDNFVLAVRESGLNGDEFLLLLLSHEYAHAVLKEMGFDYQNEKMTDYLSGVIAGLLFGGKEGMQDVLQNKNNKYFITSRRDLFAEGFEFVKSILPTTNDKNLKLQVIEKIKSRFE